MNISPKKSFNPTFSPPNFFEKQISLLFLGHLVTNSESLSEKVMFVSQKGFQN